MALDSYKIRETKIIAEKKESSLDDAKKTLENIVRNVDIDQDWIMENEVYENKLKDEEQPSVTSSTSLEDVLKQMEEIGKFGKINSLGSSNSDENIFTQSSEIYSDEDISSLLSTPLVDLNEEEDSLSIVQDEVTNNLLLEVNKKYNYLTEQVNNLDYMPELSIEILVFKNNLDGIMKEKEIVGLVDTNNALNGLLSEFSKLIQENNELKNTNEFRLDQKNRAINMLRDFQTNLEKKYGVYFFTEFSLEERKEYVSLYSLAHDVSRESVEHDIDSSIKTKEEEFKSTEYQVDYPNLIIFHGNQAVSLLKELYINYNNMEKDEQSDFNYLYSTLSNVSKSNVSDSLSEHQKLSQIQWLLDRIERLKESVDLRMNMKENQLN